MQRDRPASRRYLSYLLVFVLFNGVVLSYVLHKNMIYLYHRGFDELQLDSLTQSIQCFKGMFGIDSLYTMIPALHFLEAHPRQSPYQTLFFDQHLKFQYPLTSLLPFALLRRFGLDDAGLKFIFRAVCWCAVLANIAIGMLIAWTLLNRRRRLDASWVDCACAAAIAGAAGLMFFPIMSALALGQVQTLLSFLCVAAFYCWLTGRQGLAGLLVGITILFKPQFSILLLWFLLRKKYSSFWWALACIVPLSAVSILLFGFQANLDYIGVLHYLGAHGESYKANQSMNGLLNHLLFNGNNIVWYETRFAPYNPIVYYGTVLSSAALIGWAFFFPWKAHERGGIEDFAFESLTITMASPIAWPHHYGLLFPIFIWLAFSQSGQWAPRSRALLLGVAYVLTSNSFNFLMLLAPIPVLNILQSQLYLGAFLVLWLLATSHRAAEQDAFDSRLTPST